VSSVTFTCVGVSWDLKERVKRFGSVSWGELVRLFIVKQCLALRLRSCLVGLGKTLSMFRSFQWKWFLSGLELRGCC